MRRYSFGSGGLTLDIANDGQDPSTALPQRSQPITQPATFPVGDYDTPDHLILDHEQRLPSHEGSAELGDIDIEAEMGNSLHDLVDGRVDAPDDDFGRWTDSYSDGNHEDQSGLHMGHRAQVGSGATIGDLATVTIGAPGADVWLVRRGTEEALGRPLQEAAPEAYGLTIKPEYRDQLDPRYFYYVLQALHSGGAWRGLGRGTTRLQNLTKAGVASMTIFSDRLARLAKTMRPTAPTPGVYYHGTSAEKLPDILQHGLRAGSGTEFAPAVANDDQLAKEPAVYLTTWFEQAIRYGLGLAREGDAAVIEVQLDPTQLVEDRMDDPRGVRWPAKNMLTSAPGNPMMRGQVPITQFLYKGDIPPSAIRAVYARGRNNDLHAVPSLAGETREGYLHARDAYHALRKFCDYGHTYPGAFGLEFRVAEQLGLAIGELESLGIDRGEMTDLIQNIEACDQEGLDEDLYDESVDLYEVQDEARRLTEDIHAALFTDAGVGYLPLEDTEALTRFTPAEYLAQLQTRTAMPMPRQLPVGWKFSKFSPRPNEFTFAIKDFTEGKKGDTVAGLVITRVSPDGWEVSTANAFREGGWGAYLYERALELVSSWGETLEPDTSTSDSATQVWEKYDERARRTDRKPSIIQEPRERTTYRNETAPRDESKDTIGWGPRPEEALKYRYRKVDAAIVLHAQVEPEAPRAQRPPWVAVDLDGTILEEPPRGKRPAPPEQLELGSPLPGAQDALQELTSLGWRVSIYTARFGDERLPDETVKAWAAEISEHLARHGIPFTDIWVGRKPRADWFVDNKAIRFDGDWGAILQQLTLTGGKVGSGPLGAAPDDNGFDDPLGDMDVSDARSIPRPPALEGALYGTRGQA